MEIIILVVKPPLKEVSIIVHSLFNTGMERSNKIVYNQGEN